MAISFSPSSGINFSGIASGLNTAEIISALLAVESKATKQPLLDKKFLAQKKLDTYGTFENALKTLQDKVKGIDTLAEFLAFKATPSNSDVLTATATGSATPGSYSITITDLAEAETERMRTDLRTRTH